MRKTKLSTISKKKQAQLKKRGIKAHSTFAKKNGYGLKRSPLNKLSDKKRTGLKAEMETRTKLCKRAGGIWVKSNNLVGGYCKGGFCECGCGRPANYEGLHPHEEEHRGLGGKLSLENSLMLRNDCHAIKQGNIINPAKRRS